MARAWGSREPNSVEVECGICGTSFWTTSPIAKYCSDRCKERAKARQMAEYRARNKPQRVKKLRRERTEERRRESPVPMWKLTNADGNLIPYFFFDRNVASVSAYEELGDNFRVETDLEDILLLFRNKAIVYGRFAELRSRADSFREMVGSLERSIENVSEKKRATMIRSIRHKQKVTASPSQPIMEPDQERNQLREARETTFTMKWQEGVPAEEVLGRSREIATELSKDEEVVVEVRMVVRRKDVPNQDR